MSDIPPAIRKTVTDRANGHCEHCGVFATLELHHRLFRSRGGQHTTQNLLALCGMGNVTGCHGLAHSGDAGTHEGLAIPSGGDPAEYPVRRRIFGQNLWVVLGEGNSFAVLTDATADAIRARLGIE
jgi:hypothetical protein